MQKKDPSADDKKVMDAMLTMIHSMFTSAEVFFKHKSLSDIGPFTLVINGVKVLKVGLFFLKVILHHNI
jgi:hypothetical protein